VRVFVYEFVTAGGFVAGDIPRCLPREGQAMRRALVEDFLALGTEILVLNGARMPPPSLAKNRTAGSLITREVASPGEADQGFDEFAAAADWTIVIAPEFAGILLDRCRRVEAVGGKLLGPSPAVVAIAADKQATADCLSRAAVPTPEGCTIAAGEPLPPGFPFPAVVKPRDGAGSQQVHLVASETAARAALVAIDGPARIERYYPGAAASVAVLCGPAGQFPLPPCRQLLSDDGRFVYLGGCLPLAKPLAARATELALWAVAALPGPYGYLGVDILLGADAAGTADVVIEINPRLTTSYVGLRAAADVPGALAAAMLAVVEGRMPRLSFRSLRVEYTPDGWVGFLPC
jgi:predicted ATP-grasp superfamily ATP-dependent carboligase